MLLFTVQSLASIPRLQPLQRAKQEAERSITENMLVIRTLKYFSNCIYHMQISYY